MYLTPDNIRYWASHLHSSVDIQQRVIHFGPGAANELLLKVPLGEIDPRATIVVTVGLNESHPNTAGVDSDPYIGISDGSNENTQVLVDVNNYADYPPCFLFGAANDDPQVPTDTPAPAAFRLIFTPFYRSGSCETAQLGGYINTGTFNTQIDTTKLLFLQVRRADAEEEIFFHYFRVEIF